MGPRVRTRWLLAGLAVLTAVVVGAGYVGWERAEDAPGSRSRGRAAAENRRELDRLISAVEAEVRTQPSASAFTQLGQLYLQRARDGGVLEDYDRAAAVSDAALALAPADLDARSLHAGVLFSTHDFRGALAEAQGVVDQDPSNVGMLALSGDARLELGDYVGGAAAYDALARAEPGTAATDVRLARLAHIQGRNDEAVRLAAVALGEARGAALGGSSLAFFQAFQGEVQLDTGNYAAAARAFTDALEEDPGSASALHGMARARAAQGRRGEAIELAERSLAAQPEPDVAAFLGDLHRLANSTAEADARYAEVEVIAPPDSLQRRLHNRQLVMYYADHDVRVDEAVRLGATELEARPDVFGYDAYAWALYKSGRFADARDSMDSALAQGTGDAGMLYHAGMISRALGDASRARDELAQALAVSPKFDPVQAPLARAALTSLPPQR